MKRNFIFILFIILLFSCSTKKLSNNKLFSQLISREKYMYNIEKNRIFNPGPAMNISTLPDSIGNFISYENIEDLENIRCGLGYIKKYINNNYNNYLIDVFTYHNKQTKISNDLNDEIVKAIYNSTKNDILKAYDNSKFLGENEIIFTTPHGKTFKMNEFIFKYYDEDNEIKSYLYFSTSLDSFIKIRINYITTSENEDALFREKEDFIKDFGYYYASGISLNDFNIFKKSNKNNLVKLQRIKKYK